MYVCLCFAFVTSLRSHSYANWLSFGSCTSVRVHCSQSTTTICAYAAHLGYLPLQRKCKQDELNELVTMRRWSPESCENFNQMSTRGKMLLTKFIDNKRGSSSSAAIQSHDTRVAASDRDNEKESKLKEKEALALKTRCDLEKKLKELQASTWRDQMELEKLRKKAEEKKQKKDKKRRKSHDEGDVKDKCKKNSSKDNQPDETSAPSAGRGPAPSGKEPAAPSGAEVARETSQTQTLEDALKDCPTACLPSSFCPSAQTGISRVSFGHQTSECQIVLCAPPNPFSPVLLYSFVCLSRKARWCEACLALRFPRPPCPVHQTYFTLSPMYGCWASVFSLGCKFMNRGVVAVFFRSQRMNKTRQT